ncbi:MAG: 2-isopropylmalate synthase, partial [Myxococcota bacterium]|nr:2-isopropylmalate synthase [Myxococcota bacterium]
DETLRDGLQSPSVTDPDVDKKLELLELMEQLGISCADIGLPGAGSRAKADVLAMAKAMSENNFKIKATCAARTKIEDIEPIADVVQKTGVPIEVYAFIGSSPIRLFAENWSVDTLRKHIEAAVSFGVKEGLDVCLVTEDTTRSRPDTLDSLFRLAIDLGVKRLCLCDTVGHATPEGITNLFDWTEGLLRSLNVDIKLDWHGHNDRGLGVSNSLHAIVAGADRVHGTALGIGERVGNAAMDQILLNLKLLGEWEPSVTMLRRYCEVAAEACNVDLAYNYPMAGRDAFRTATGVHAAAIIKAKRRNDDYLADRVYSGVPARMFGKEQEIEVGYMSGKSNVSYWLESHNIESDEDLLEAIFQAAKASKRILSESEIMEIVYQHQGSLRVADPHELA